MTESKQQKYSFAVSGLMAAGAMVCGNQVMSIAGLSMAAGTIYPLAAVCAVGGIVLDRLLRENEYEKLFRLCGIVNKADQVPLVIKKQKNDIKTTLVVHLPEGISQKHFEQKQQELEQGLNCKINFSYNKNLIMELINMNLGPMYKYEFEERENPTEVLAGYTHEGRFYFDIDKATQTIVAGEPNSGKSSLLRTIILSLILNKHDVDLHLIDFQGVELGIFQDCKKVKSYGEKPEDFEKLLNEMEEEAERRLKLFTSVRKKHYIQKLSVWNKYYPEQALPYKVCIIDEFARLAEKDYEDLLEKFRNRVAMDRKTGILYIASMQRPDVKIISGSIKGSMSTRIAFKTVTDTDSEVILDVEGAEKIKNQGRCLMKYLGEMKEVQCLYIEPEDVRSILKKHKAFKTVEDQQREKQEYLKKWREQNINPYAKGV